MISKLKVKDIESLFKCQPIIVHKETSVVNVVDKLIDDPINRNVYVVDKDNRLIGAVLLVSILEKIFPREFQSRDSLTVDMDLIDKYLAKSAGGMMTKCSDDYVNGEDDLATTFHKMKKHEVTQLPIVNENRCVTGIVHIEHILTAWYQKIYSKSSLN